MNFMQLVRIQYIHYYKLTWLLSTIKMGCLRRGQKSAMLRELVLLRVNFYGPEKAQLALFTKSSNNRLPVEA